MINFAEKPLQKLGYEFHVYQKTRNGNVVTSLFSGKGIPKLFYFQARESSNIEKPIVRESRGIIQN